MERKELFQYQQTISVPREKLIKNVIENESLSLDDLRVCLLLLTELDGWDIDRKFVRPGTRDPENFKRVDIDAMSETLNIKRKKVKESIDVLLRDEIIEVGETRAAKIGYRFTF